MPPSFAVPASILSRVHKGEIAIEVSGSTRRGVANLVAWGAFKSSPAAVWKILDDGANYVRTMPRVKLSEVIWRKEHSLRMRVVLNTPFPMPDLHAEYESLHTIGDGLWKREWQQMNKSLLPNSGSWRLCALPDSEHGTLAEYRVQVELRIPVPAAIINFAQQRLVPEMFRGIDKHAGVLAQD